MSDIKITYYQKITNSEAFMRQCILFGMIAFLYWFNKNYLGDSTIGYVTGFLFVLIFLTKFLIVNSNTTRTFDNKKDTIAFINSLPNNEEEKRNG